MIMGSSVNETKGSYREAHENLFEKVAETPKMRMGKQWEEHSRQRGVCVKGPRWESTCLLKEQKAGVASS